MSRTRKGKKGPGYDYGGKRPGNKGYCNSPGKGVKAETHRRERRESDRIVRDESTDLRRCPGCFFCASHVVHDDGEKAIAWHGVAEAAGLPRCDGSGVAPAHRRPGVGRRTP